jgi:hypothetical protein
MNTQISPKKKPHNAVAGIPPAREKKMKITFLNKTPHAISLRRSGGIEVLEPTGNPVRVASTLGEVIETDDGLEILAPGTAVVITNLPPARKGTIVIVSQIACLVAAQHRPERQDLVYPLTSKYHGAERDGNGITAVSRLARCR